MTEKERLLGHLRRQGEDEWSVVAIHALSLDDSNFEGIGSSSAGELLSIYRIRESRRSAKGIVAYGLEHFLSSLAQTDPSALVELLTFKSAEYSVTVFFGPDGALLGCVTVRRHKFVASGA
jgi:hypothetical protein